VVPKPVRVGGAVIAVISAAVVGTILVIAQVLFRLVAHRQGS
jgi:hypothetical protein